MNGREMIEAAFSPEGTCEIPAVICYESIFIRDHLEELTRLPWWHSVSPDLSLQLSWKSEVIDKIGQDWFVLPSCNTKAEREAAIIKVCDGEPIRFNRLTGGEEKLMKPPVGGTMPASNSAINLEFADTIEKIDHLVPSPPVYNKGNLRAGGGADLADMLLERYGSRLFPFTHVLSPLWFCNKLWGFEGMMIMIATEPELVKYVSKKYLDIMVVKIREAAELGAAGIWIEECYTDLISPDAFRELNLPLLRQLTDEIRSQGMKSIYYYCGSPERKLDMIISSGADAISLEEGKKNFQINIEDLTEAVRGRCTLFGNLDSIGILQDGDENSLKTEISRQLAAGRKNKSRFVMSIGSPVTPATPVDRVRLYCDLVHELGRR